MATELQSLKELLAETQRIRDRVAAWPEGSMFRAMRLAGCARDISRLEAEIQRVSA